MTPERLNQLHGRPPRRILYRHPPVDAWKPVAQPIKAQWGQNPAVDTPKIANRKASPIMTPKY